LVEHVTENHGVPSSILGFGTTSGSGSAVEHLLAKERVASSNLVFRSFFWNGSLNNCPRHAFGVAFLC
jgi:hypothetical protein